MLYNISIATQSMLLPFSPNSNIYKKYFYLVFLSCRNSFVPTSLSSSSISYSQYVQELSLLHLLLLLISAWRDSGAHLQRQSKRNTTKQPFQLESLF